MSQPDIATRLNSLDFGNDRIQYKANRSFGIIGQSANFLAALDLARRVAPSHASVFISGESGTGKEIFAKFIHSESKQSKGPFVAIKCSAMPETLFESELFGHAKGAFTGPQEKKIKRVGENQYRSVIRMRFYE